MNLHWFYWVAKIKKTRLIKLSLFKNQNNKIEWIKHFIKENSIYHSSKGGWRQCHYSASCQIATMNCFWDYFFLESSFNAATNYPVLFSFCPSYSNYNRVTWIISSKKQHSLPGLSFSISNRQLGSSLSRRKVVFRAWNPAISRYYCCFYLVFSLSTETQMMTIWC